jgi:ribonuclease Z
MEEFMLRRHAWFSGVALFAAGIGFGAWLISQEDRVSSLAGEIGGALGVSSAQAQGSADTADNEPLGRKPVAIVDGQYPASYFPNTELLGADEMRITALGTGMPNQTKAAVSISYLVELGNGDKFLFDMGMGAMGNLFSLRPT